MEPNSQNTKTAESKTDPSNLGSIDLNSFLKNENTVEFLKHLLSGGVAMAGNYFIWIKPMQDRIEDLSRQLYEQGKRINDLERELNKVREPQEKERLSGLKNPSEEFFPIRKMPYSTQRSGKQPYTRI